jgi:hypothetical protein
MATTVVAVDATTEVELLLGIGEAVALATAAGATVTECFEEGAVVGFSVFGSESLEGGWSRLLSVEGRGGFRGM